MALLRLFRRREKTSDQIKITEHKMKKSNEAKTPTSSGSQSPSCNGTEQPCSSVELSLRSDCQIVSSFSYGEDDSHTPTSGNDSDSPSSTDDSVESSGSSFKKPITPRTNSSRKLYRHFSSSRFSSASSAIGLDEVIEDRREAGSLSQNVIHIEIPCGMPIEEVYDGVKDGPVLGSGISGEVRLGTHKATGVKYAVKVLDLDMVKDPMQLRDEILIMSKLDHPNIVRLFEVYESPKRIYLVQELCLGGELFDRLDEQPDYHYSEGECARLVKQMLSAVRYLHSKGIIHRDLKLENFLFSSAQPDSDLKLIDFGLSKHFEDGEIHHEAVGTPYTVAPEVIRGSYDERCDLWAVGVIAYLLLSGVPPFGGCGGPEPLIKVRSNILSGSFSFEPPELWEHVSKQAKNFIQSLLVTDPRHRPTAEEAQKHEWIQDWINRQSEGERALNPNVVKALVNFKGYSDMRKLLHEVLSFTLLPDQIKDLRTEFEKMDTDGSGEISLPALKKVLLMQKGPFCSLTEKDVTDIFDAMRVHKGEDCVRWHEFIAAGLSQCPVDDRNLRLAFERLDSDHKGLITIDDIKDLMGSDAPQIEEALRELWGDSTRGAKLLDEGIGYDDFLLLMKGEDLETAKPRRKLRHNRSRSKTNLRAVPEIGAGQHGKSPVRSLADSESKEDMDIGSVVRFDGFEEQLARLKIALGWSCV